MEIDTAYGALDLIETDVVEPFETSARYSSYAVVGDEEIFFPSHKNMLALSKVTVCEVGPLRLLGKWLPGRETRPMMNVCLLIGSPFLVTSLECMLGANNFAFEECCQSRVIFSEALDTQVAAQVRLGHIHVLDFHVHIIDLAVRLLSPDESTSGAEKGR